MTEHDDALKSDVQIGSWMSTPYQYASAFAKLDISPFA